MSNITLAFILTLVAGLSTMLGTIFIFIKLNSEEKLIASSLSFASGVMLCISITDLIPESILMLKDKYNGFIMIIIVFIFIMLGIIISNFIDKTIPKITNRTSLYKLGIISMLAIILHNIPEGIITFIGTTKNTSLGLSLAIAIALHNIPEGISISVPIYYSTKSKTKALVYTLISALSEPLGAFLTYLFLINIITNTILGLLFSLTAGIMIYISLIELLPGSNGYRIPKLTRIFFILGIIFMLLNHFI